MLKSANDSMGESTSVRNVESSENDDTSNIGRRIKHKTKENPPKNSFSSSDSPGKAHFEFGLAKAIGESKKQLSEAENILNSEIASMGAPTSILNLETTSKDQIKDKSTLNIQIQC